MKPHIEQIQPSFFEITVAMAFEYFSKEEVDIAIIETGLGGRLDSTNVILPEVSLITNIGFDHTDMLGDTLEQIANEKAGIIKSGIPVVLGTYQEEIIHVFHEKADESGATLTIASTDLLTEKAPYYLARNAAGIYQVIEELRKKGWNISVENEQKGFADFEKITGFKGRFQVLKNSPLIIADVSHNKEGLGVLFDQIEKIDKEHLYLIFGTTQEKDLDRIFDVFPNTIIPIWTQSHVPRAMPVEQLELTAKKRGFDGKSFSDVNHALRFAEESANGNDLILITGSTFVVAELDVL